jgi:hypothetical protein
LPHYVIQAEEPTIKQLLADGTLRLVGATEQRSDEDVVGMLDYLALKRRVALFEGDFQSRVIDWYRGRADETYRLVMAETLWKSVMSRGIVGTYQEFISDPDATSALAHAINI